MSTHLITVDEARTIILDALTAVETETIRFADGADRVLAQQVSSILTLPPFSNSAMDGFAVRSADLQEATTASPAELTITGEVAAGQIPQGAIGEGEAYQISTGAPIPVGADSVVPLEWTRAPLEGPHKGKHILVERSIEADAHIRPAGQDVREGDVLLFPGHKLRPADIGLLASIGQAVIQVYRRPRVVLFSSGDELIEPDQALTPGKIHDSNRYALSAAVAQLGADVVRLPIATDTQEQVNARLEEAVSCQADLILSSAGVSVGEHDHVRAAVEEQGRLTFWRVNIRPGKPLAFGSFQDIPFMGLPGNPVSSMVTFEVFARPAIERLAGLLGSQRFVVRVKMLENVSSDRRETFLRAIVRRTDEGFDAKLAGSQDSGVLSSLVRANALVRIPAGQEHVVKGDQLEAWLLSPPPGPGQE